jgi:hypothetical protein
MMATADGDTNVCVLVTYGVFSKYHRMGHAQFAFDLFPWVGFLAANFPRQTVSGGSWLCS